MKHSYTHQIVSCKCPTCLSQLRTSRFKWFEYAMLLVLQRPYRCWHCGARYMRSLLLAPSVGSQLQTERK